MFILTVLNYLCLKLKKLEEKSTSYLSWFDLARFWSQKVYLALLLFYGSIVDEMSSTKEVLSRNKTGYPDEWTLLNMPFVNI